MDATHRRRVPISYVEIHEDEIAAVVEVLRSGHLRQGPEVAAFEEEFAHSVGAEHALAVSSGTAALQMAYAALLRAGDEVLVPAFTYYATAAMVAAVGAIPVFCDVEAETLTIDVADAAGRITPRTRAVAPVHLFGNPANVLAVQELARRHELHVVWDAAQAHGTLYDGRDIGGLATAVCYSFYPSKNMTTGEGGMVCTGDPDLAARMSLIRSQGESERYVHTVLGYNFRMTDIQAAIGRGQLRYLPEWTARRRENAAYLRRRLAESERITVQQEEPRGAHSYHQFSVLLDGRIHRDSVVEALRARGVECAVHYPLPLHHQPVFRSPGAAPSLPVSERSANHILSLPVHPRLTADDLTYVADAVLEETRRAALNRSEGSAR